MLLDDISYSPKFIDHINKSDNKQDDVASEFNINLGEENNVNSSAKIQLS